MLLDTRHDAAGVVRAADVDLAVVSVGPHARSVACAQRQFVTPRRTLAPLGLRNAMRKRHRLTGGRSCCVQYFRRQTPAVA